MKPHEHQLPLVAVYISQSSNKENLLQHTKHERSKSRHSKHHKHNISSCYETSTFKNSSKIPLTNKKSRSISSNSSIHLSPNKKHHNQPKTYYLSKQIKEEYNLHHNQQKPAKSSHKNCPYKLHQCQYINHHLSRITNQLSQQKMKNSLLKKRNKQLIRENQLFNEYFQVFEGRYKYLKEKNRAEEIMKKVKEDQIRHDRKHSKHSTYHKSKQHQLTHVYDRINNSSLNSDSQYQPTPISSHKRHHHHPKASQTQNIQNYPQIYDENQQSTKRHKHHKQYSSVTRQSSRPNSRENFNFQTSRFQDMHFRRK